jgi:hypothetical protein
MAKAAIFLMLLDYRLGRAKIKSITTIDRGR